jgi:hypothetical protein
MEHYCMFLAGAENPQLMAFGKTIEIPVGMKRKRRKRHRHAG